jgi:transposase InsO family protein
MMLVHGRPAAGVTPTPILREPRRNRNLLERVEAIKPLLGLYDEQGYLAPRDYRWMAHALDRSERWVREMFDEALAIREAPPVPRNAALEPDAILPYGFLMRVAANQGNVAAALRDYHGGDLGSDATVYRQMAQIHPGLKLALKHGRKALDQYMELGVYEPDYRNQLWEADEMHLPIRARGPHGIVEDLWLLVFIEVWSRLIVAASLHVGPADEEFAAAVYWAGVIGWDAPGLHVGGSPETLLTDNGWIFKKSKHFKAAVRASGAAQEFATPYTPQGKPHVERWNWTHVLKGLAGLGGLKRGPMGWTYEKLYGPDGEPQRRRVEVPMLVLPDGKEPSVAQVARWSASAIERYNLQDVHSTFGEVPALRYGSVQRVERRFGAGAAWPYAVRVPDHLVGGRGIHYDKWLTVNGVLRVGETAQVAVLPSFRGRVLVGKDDHFRGEATEHSKESQDLADLRAERNHRALRLVDRLFADAQDLLAASAGHPQSEPKTKPRRRRAAKDQRLGNPDLAMKRKRDEHAA